MSRIDELLAEQCPDGVPFRPMGEWATLVRGNGMPRSDFSPNGVGCIHYGQVYTHYGTFAERTLSFVSPEKATRLAKVDPGDIVITNTSENVEDVCKAVAWLGRDEIVTGGHATVIKHGQDPKYLSYYFQTAEFHAAKKKRATGTKVIDVSAKSLAEIAVPLPPIQVQREIVDILDTFSALEAELEAELEARRKQYAHFRSLILNHQAAELVRLGDLGRWVGGLTPSKEQPKYWAHGQIPWVASMDVDGSTDIQVRSFVTEAALAETALRTVPGPAVVAVMRSNILRRRLPIGMTTCDVTLNQDVKGLIALPGVEPRYVRLALLDAAERIRAACVRVDGSMAAVDTKRFLAYAIPLPSLAEQGRIAAALDAFDALVSDLSSGLPAELAARRKQYEYYRDKLLTFREAS